MGHPLRLEQGLSHSNCWANLQILDQPCKFEVHTVRRAYPLLWCVRHRSPTVRLEFSGPSLESLNGKRQSSLKERSRKLQTPRSSWTGTGSTATTSTAVRSPATSTRVAAASLVPILRHASLRYHQQPFVRRCARLSASRQRHGFSVRVFQDRVPPAQACMRQCRRG